MSVAVPRGDSVVVMHDVEWSEYERLRDDPDHDHVRMTYDRGVLTFTPPSRSHDQISRMLQLMVYEWAKLRPVPLASCDAATQREPERRIGLEPDECFYIQKQSPTGGLDQADWDSPRPPDLAIEVEVSNPFRGRLPLYATLCVPEVWHWRVEALTVYRLVDNAYVAVPESVLLPGFPLGEAQRLLLALDDELEMTLISRFEVHIRSLP